ncbi:hypothetical protein J6590_000513 [Homalodisca vitripennis]|nr:hypothetical protein J6590_000513 [Homalodisca vitripennis]
MISEKNEKRGCTICSGTPAQGWLPMSAPHPCWIMTRPTVYRAHYLVHANRDTSVTVRINGHDAERRNACTLEMREQEQEYLGMGMDHYVSNAFRHKTDAVRIECITITFVPEDEETEKIRGGK